MTRRGAPDNKSLLRIMIMAALLGVSVNGVYAQDQVEEDEDATEQEEAADLDRVTVTGSRLQRETYTSISPLQIITATESREAGLIDPAEILQKSTAAAGQQIDLSFTGFVLDNGPGASTIDLRGLGAARTLVLVNGRRLAPSGVEGAPASPDLNLVPSSLVQRYEVLLDGASSVYGSDAVAGVTNVIMRKDFDGLEFDVFYNSPDYKNGENYTATAAWGMNFDRGMFGIGLEYSDYTEIRLRDRPWTAGCGENYEITTNGEIRSENLWYKERYGMDFGNCQGGATAGRTLVPGALGYIYYTPGYSNGAFGNFSEAVSPYGGFGVDGNGDGITDVNYNDYDIDQSEQTQNSTFWPEQKRLSVMGYGEYTFEGDMNNKVYFEFNYNDREVTADGGAYQIFPYVPANNPYNLCNPNAPGGVDCGLASDALYTNPNYITQFADYYTETAGCFGLPYEACTPAAFGLLNGALGPQQTRPIVSVIGDRVIYETTMKQYRGVVGMNGDLPFVDWGSMNNWVYDVSLSYTTSKGTSSRPGIRGDRLELALGWYSSTDTPCVNDQGYSRAPSYFGRPIYGDTAAGCVPVDMFASSLYEGNVGDFGSAAERDYLFDTRDFDTEYTQTILSAYANGFLFELPGGTALGGIGWEWREDDINSSPDEVAREGLFWGFFADGGATGKKWTNEVFGEVELPLMAGVPLAEELTLNLSGRWTDDEFYGADTTYTMKLGYRPINSLLLRSTYGTSFRAPSVREVFLQDQTGFLTLADPCAVPQSALGDISTGGGYDPSLDTRDPIVLENCRLQGVDPTALIINNGVTQYSVEIARGGTTELEAERSTAVTYGFAFEQPWFEAFDLTFGMTWYDIEVTDTIIDPSAQFLINDCYNDPQYDSTFCDTIIRDQNGFLDIVNAYFINRDSNRARGMDINANYDQNFNFGSTAVRFGVDLAINRNDEASTKFIDDDGNADFEDFSRSTYYPKWRGQLGLRTQVEDFRFTWVVNYTGKAPQYGPDVDEFDDILGNAGTGFLSDTCLGPPDDVYCRDYADIDEYWLHSASLYWYGDTITIGAGIRNVFDEAPPRVDGDEVLAINNVPIGGSYDLFGRTYFFNLIWRP
ncbi:MAG: TonB-dependent receptor [Xanthomonadales bacterium]